MPLVKTRSAPRLDDAVGVRQLSHETTKVLKDLEADPRLVAITRHGKFVALLIPIAVPSLVRRWLDLNPRRASIMRSRVMDLIPGLDTSDESATGSQEDPPTVVAVGIKEFAQATSEYLRRAEEGEWVFLRRHSRPVALLVRFSLTDLVRMTIDESDHVPSLERPDASITADRSARSPAI